MGVRFAVNRVFPTSYGTFRWQKYHSTAKFTDTPPRPVSIKAYGSRCFQLRRAIILTVQHPQRRNMPLENGAQRSKRLTVVGKNFTYDLVVRLSQQALRRYRIFRSCRLTEFDRHRLVAHKRLVSGEKIG